jgi:hypothetical protein
VGFGYEPAYPGIGGVGAAGDLAGSMAGGSAPLLDLHSGGIVAYWSTDQQNG